MARRRKPNNRPNGRGTLFIERTYPEPVGLVRRASGTNDSKAFTDILNMMDNLARSVPPRFDILLAIKDKSLSPLYALSLWRQGKLEQLPTADTLPQLQPAWEEWARTRTGISDEYRKRLGQTIKQLMRHKENATVGDLPMMLESYREECVLEDKPTQFNRVKAHVQAFVKATLRRRSQLYGEVSDIDNLEEAKNPVRRPQKPQALAEILQLLPEPHRTMAWELAITGMRPKEYFDGQWWMQFSAPEYLEVKKSKTDAGERDIPLWAGALLGPVRSRDAFEEMWRRRIGALLDIYDLRRSFAVWMEDAGIPRSRRKLYLGHSAGDVTGLYESRELMAWIEEDAQRLRTYAGRVVDARTNQDADGDGEGSAGDVAPAYAGRSGE